MTTNDTAVRARRVLEDLIVAVDQLIRENRELERRVQPPDNKPKLSAQDVVRIRTMSRNGCSQADIAECLDVHRTTIHRILNGTYHK